MILKDTIQHIKNQGITAYVIFLDVTKAYDKAWLKAILYTLYYTSGVRDKTWDLTKKLNEDLTATIRTKYGTTRPITITDSIRQGRVLSVILYANLMDEINKRITQSNTPPIMEQLQEETGCLLWVDDVVLIADNPINAQKLLNITNKVTSTYHVEFGTEKSRVLKIGSHNQPNPVLTLGTTYLQYTDKYKYLGEIINNHCNLKDHITAIRGKAEAAFQKTLTLTRHPTLKIIHMQTMWKLRSMHPPNHNVCM